MIKKLLDRISDWKERCETLRDHYSHRVENRCLTIMGSEEEVIAEARDWARKSNRERRLQHILLEEAFLDIMNPKTREEWRKAIATRNNLSLDCIEYCKQKNIQVK